MTAAERFVQWARPITLVGVVLGVISFAAIVAVEVGSGGDVGAMSSPAAVSASWLSFVGTVAMLVGVIAVLLAVGDRLGAGGAGAGLIVVVGACMSIATAATLALVVPHLSMHAPDIAINPPAAVPATHIASGFVTAVGGIWLAMALRRAGVVPGWVRTMLIVVSVVGIAPLPARFLLLTAALSVVLWQVDPGSARTRTSQHQPAHDLSR